MDVFFCFILYGIIFLKFSKQLYSCYKNNASVNSSCAQLRRATAGHLPALSVPGVGHLQILRSPGAGHLPTFAFWHELGFLLEYNYTEDFTGKTSRLARLSRTGKNWRGLQSCVLDFRHAFLHCSSSQNYIAKLGSGLRESMFFWLLNQVSLDIIWRTSFHNYKTIHSS